MAQNGSKRPAAQPDLEDLQSDPRQHTSSKNVRDATGTKPAHTEAAEQSLNRFSRTITQSKSQGGSQAMLYATGMTESDMDKPQVRVAAVVVQLLGMHLQSAQTLIPSRINESCMQVGISSVWWEGNPCNMHLHDLAQEVKEGCHEAGLVGLRFNTIGISDAISMGTDGMW